ncbi:MAG: sugar phosphate isomerase/epimerase family protein [bacterium]|nr:sugar phosphate isomerase/epimerase family protein [bacterium]
MRFGVNAWVWVSPLTTEALRELAPKVKSMGFDWIEVPLEAIGDLDAQEGAAILRDLDLGVSACAAMGPDRDLIHPDAAIRDNGMHYIRQCVEVLHALGGSHLVGPIYSAVGRVWQQTPDERAADFDLLTQNLSVLAGYAADHGCVIAIEPLNRFETSFLNLASQAVEVVDRVDHPGCKIMLDTFHMNIEEKSLGAAIRTAGARMVHFHACENDRGAPGSGNVTWPEVAAALHDIGYEGPVVIESFTDKVKSIARAAAIWRSFEPSQDALAQNGVHFLKSLLVQPEGR